MLAGNFVEQLEESSEQVHHGDTETRSEESSETEDATAFDPGEFGNFSFDFGENAFEESETNARSLDSARDDNNAAAFPTPTVSTADILKFLIDRTRYIKILEDEDTPEAYSRIENLRELMNAAMDSKDRGETLDEFLDHAALIADADDYDERAQITLMSLHA